MRMRASFSEFFFGKKINMVQRRYAWGKVHYGEIIDEGRCHRLKKKIRARLGIKPRVRYKLRTVRTQYCGYVFTEWK